VTADLTAEFGYTVANNRLTAIFKDAGSKNGSDFAAPIPIRIAGDTFTQRGTNLFGKDVSMKRLQPARGDDPIFGVWSFVDYTGVTVFAAFARNGRGALRIPVGSCTGSWTARGTGGLTVSTCILWLLPRKLTCTLPRAEANWEYTIENGILILKTEDGRVARFNRPATL
jgi:hypothetical protein